MKIYQLMLLYSLIISGTTKKLYKNLQNKSVLKGALMLGTGVALSEQSWGQIDQSFAHLEGRVSMLEQIYNEDISNGLDQIKVMQSSIYPIFGILILCSIIGIAILFKKLNKDDLASFLNRASKIPDYIHRIRSSNLFQSNNTHPTAPYHHNIHAEMINHNPRANPYYNGFPEPNQNMARNNGPVQNADPLPNGR